MPIPYSWERISVCYPLSTDLGQKATPGFIIHNRNMVSRDGALWIWGPEGSVVSRNEKLYGLGECA